MKNCIGITGGIASGKSTITQYYAQKGFDVFSADLVAKQLTAKSQPALKEIVQHFGEKVLKEDHEINRAYLREIIFQNLAEKQWLEKLLHPKIRQELHKLVKQSSNQNIVIEIPLLTNRKDYPYINHVIFIDTPLAQQIQRIMQRDQCSQEAALNIIKNQPTKDVYMAVADEIINNDGDLEKLRNAARLDVLY